MQQLKKLSFIHYIGHCSKVLNALDPLVLGYLERYWEEKESLL